MPREASPKQEAADFPGLAVNIDARDLPPGAASEQVNICSMVPGEMRTRLGIREVEFAEE